MKATGVVRRIDELGRIVIPKEIRRTLKIKEGTPLEIYSGDNGELLLKKYSPVAELGELAKEVCESIYKSTSLNVIITNMESVVASSGQGKNLYINKPIDSHIEKLINMRKTQIISITDAKTRLFDDNENVKLYAISPIFANGDVYGSIIIFDEKNNLSDCEKKIASSFADYLSKQVE
jgi:AbrB family transcriptional regulator (stage V sporulation protein T)